MSQGDNVYLDHERRIARLEAQVKDIDEKLDSIERSTNEIHKELTRYRGFIGGVFFIVSSILTFLNFYKDWKS